MRPPLYERQLRQDLDRWTADGLISGDQRDAILKAVGADEGRPVTDWLGLFGAILIGAGAISFIAANWEDTTRALRLALLGGGLIGAYAVALIFFRSGAERMGQAFVLLGVAVFGAAIALIGQTYHFNADYPGGILLWGLGAMAAALLVPSRTALGLAIALGALWTNVETLEYTREFHPAYLVYWATGLALVYGLKWWAGFHLSVLAAIYWILISADHLEEILGIPDEPLAYALLAFALFIAGLFREARPARIAASYGAVLFIGLMCFDYLNWLDVSTRPEPMGPTTLAVKPDGESIVADGAGQAAAPAETVSSEPAMALTAMLPLAAPGAILLVLAFMRRRTQLSETGLGLAFLALAATLPITVEAIGIIVPVIMYWMAMVLVLIIGVTRQHRTVINVAMIGFGAGVLITYFDLFGSLLQTAAFFTLGGVLFIILSLVIAWLNRRLIARQKGAVS